MGRMIKLAADARRKELLKNPQWDELLGLNEPTDRGLCLVALDPAGSTGWCVLVFNAEGVQPTAYHGQCELSLLNVEMGPLIRGRRCLVSVERGYIGWPKYQAEDFANSGHISLREYQEMADELRKSERSMIKFHERVGKILGWCDANLVLAGPVWRPTATQWRSKIRDFKGVKGRDNLKATAVRFAERITGDPFTKQGHWTENKSKRFKAGKALDDEADATCINYASLKYFKQGDWPRWEDV